MSRVVYNRIVALVDLLDKEELTRLKREVQARLDSLGDGGAGVRQPIRPQPNPPSTAKEEPAWSVGGGK